MLHLLPEFELRGHEERKARVQAAGRGAMVFVVLDVLTVGGVTVWMLSRTPDTPPAPREVTTFNGSAALGDHTLGQIVFPATHNAMGSPDDPAGRS
jgi:hypothetical protein